MSAYAPIPSYALPPPNGPSHHPPGTLFMACPGNAQPWGGAHHRPVYLAVDVCRTTAKSSKRPPARTARCTLCGARLFLHSQWWSQGITADQIVSLHGPGVAVDGFNGLF